jgi:ribonuclease HI
MGQPVEDPVGSQSGSAVEVVEIYVDGACRGNAGPGGWAASIEWHGVRGHSGVPGNERVDLLANQAIDALLR